MNHLISYLLHTDENVKDQALNKLEEILKSGYKELLRQFSQMKVSIKLFDEIVSYIYIYTFDINSYITHLIIINNISFNLFIHSK